jgi:uncharacterized OB-fold protein
MSCEERALPALNLNAESRPYFEAAGQGVLKLRRCTSCSKVHFYPRALCPYCLGDTEWIAASGAGTIYSVSVCRRLGPVPYAIAYVRLEEGVTVLTNIVDCDFDALRIGDRVSVCFKPAEGGMVPMFKPAAQRAAPERGVRE